MKEFNDLMREAHDKSFEVFTLIGDALEFINSNTELLDYDTQAIEELHEIADELQAGLYDFIIERI